MFFRALKLLQELGFLSRQQPRKNGDFVLAKESFDLSVAPKGRTGFQFVPGALFDGSLSVQALAALIYLRSHAPTYPVHGRYLRKRFDWCQKTMHKVMAELRGLGHVEQVKLRDKGKFTGVVYTVHGADTFQQPSGQKPDTPTPDALTAR